MHVLRWGQSEYETLVALEGEREGAESLGMTWDSHRDTSTPSLRGVDALVVNSAVQVDAAALKSFKGSLILSTTSGYDHIDLDLCKSRGIIVARLPDARRDAVVAHALSGMIALMRCFPQLQRAARDNRWARADLPSLAPVALDRSNVAVVGLGVIGKVMARALQHLGANVLGVDPAGVPEGIENCELDDALSRADAVTLHCSLNDSTRELFTGARIDKMPRGGVLVNTARGAILDVESAVERVRTGQLRGLLVDVFPVEPYKRLGHGALVPGVVFTPHAAGYTKDLGLRVARGVVTSLQAWRDNEPLPYRVV